MKRIFILAILLFGAAYGFQSFRTVKAHADTPNLCPASPNVKDICAAPAPGDECLAAVPAATPMPGSHRVIQLVNCSNQALLGTANAAYQTGKNPTAVLPRERTWVMAPFMKGSVKHPNVLTIDIPPEWENTKCPPKTENAMCAAVGPRLWARTGCRYNIDFDKAQCETGGCSGRYDCSAARLAASVGTTVSEWTLYEEVCTDQKNCGTSKIVYHKDSPDISAVDGVNLNMDIRPVGGCPRNPFDYQNLNAIYDPEWLNQNCPLTQHGEDLRDSTRCQPAGFQLKRSNLTGKTAPQYAFVEVDAKGNPIGGDSTVSCFSNCGKYAWPTAPAEGCNLNDPTCYAWRIFCAGNPKDYFASNMTICGSGGSNIPNCMNSIPPTYYDSKCFATGSNKSVLASCWYNPGSTTNGHCNVRAFLKGSNCPPDVCTFPYKYQNPISKLCDFGTQPPFGSCADVKLNGTALPCIGDDTMHDVMRKAYTWPNDPQVYGGNASLYQVIFSPGGTSVGITPSSSIPSCNDKIFVGAPYNYETNSGRCANPRGYGAVFGIAHPNANWDCDLDPSGAGDNGIICKWPLVSPIQQVGLRVNFNSAGKVLPLNVNPGVIPGDLLLASITFNGNATPSAPSGWTPVSKADVTSSNRLQRSAVWYHFVKAGDFASYTWTWNAQANPAGSITSWRGVDSKTPFDAIAATKTGSIAAGPAMAPSIATATANARLLSIFGGGGTTANEPSFGLPQGGPGIGIDETGAAKLNGGLPATSGTYYAHLVGNRIQSAGMTKIQSVTITQQKGATGGDWTAISMALKPAATGPTATPRLTPKPTSTSKATPTATPKKTPTTTPKRTPTPTPKKPTPTATRKPTPTPTKRP